MAIGVYDSGIGGLTVYKVVAANFKNQDLIYFGDVARVPYGNRSRETIIRYSIECGSFLKEKYNIEVVPFFVSFDEEKYYKEIEEIAIRDVYEKMVAAPKRYPKTSLPSVQNYVDAFLPHIEAGRAVICICITTSLSGSYNSAVNAKEIICEDYPDAKIEVVNSYGATVYQRLYAIEAARMQQQGYSFEENVRILKGQMRDTARIFFTVGDLDYLQHGGRIGKVAGIAGSVLNLKPLITLEGGSIDSSGVARSRKKSMLKTIELLKSYFKENGEDPENYAYAVGFGYDRQEGEQYKKMVDEALMEMGAGDGADLVQIGATICVHTGPYAIGVGLVKRFEYCG